MKENSDSIQFWQYGFAVLISIILITTSITVIVLKVNHDIQFTQQERRGLAQVDRLHGMRLILQKIRGLSQIVRQNNQTTAQAEVQPLVNSLEKSFDDFKQKFPANDFAIGTLLADLHKASLELASDSPKTMTRSALFDRHTALIDQLQDMTYTIATRSNLILDSELETYFLMDLLINNLPQLIESIGKTRGYGSGLLATPSPQEVERFQFGEKLGGLRQSWRDVNRAQRIILQASPSMHGLFSCFTDDFERAARPFVSLSEKLQAQQLSSIDPKQFFQQGTAAITAASHCYGILAQELSRLLTKRVAKLEKERIYLVVGLMLTLVFVIFIFTRFYRKNINALSEIRGNEARTKAIFESAVDGIVTIDEAGIIRSNNASIENIFGYSTGELIGKNINILIPSPHREAHDGYIKNYLTTGKRAVVGSIREVYALCKDGGRFPLELSVSEFRADGKVFFTGILHDITERKKAKEALASAYTELEHRVLQRTHELQVTNQQMLHEIEERKLAESGLRLAAKVFDNASEAILVTDPDGNIIEVNQAFTSITRFEKSEVIGKNPRITKSGRHDQEFYKKMWAAILTKGQWAGEIWDRRKNGEIYPKWLSINAVKDGNDQLTNFVAIFSDISHIKATEQRLEQLAFYDPLTKLPNRMLFRDRLIHEFSSAKRLQQRVAVFFIDLDRFKHVNDTLGHAAGDQLLIEVAQRLSACVRASDTVSRLGGDEFTVILAGLSSGQEAAVMAQKIVETVQKPYDLNGHQAHIGASIGIGVYPEDGEDFDVITKHADVAMYNAKESGRGNFKFFKTEMNTKATNRVLLENEMHLALEANQFILHYQPKVNIESGRVLGMESLVRWQKADGTMVSPADFIPLAEETGLIVPMGEQILRMACQQNKLWMDAGLSPLKVAVNLSARQFEQKDFYKTVEAILAETGLPPDCLELEVTESMMMIDEKKAITTLSRLRDIGLSIAMDDFGTGYSSLSYLKRFPIHALKIDQSFVRDLTVDSNDAAIVSAIVSMSKSLHLHVVAEGVETNEQLEFLRKIGCHELQGYFISRPIPADAFERFVREDQLMLARKS